jgi:putative ABC transport system permease protein
MLLAFAEVRRSLGRFSLLVGSVALLVILLLFFQAVAGALTGGLTGAYEAASADVWVYDDSARRNPQASVLQEGATDAVADLDGVEIAAAVTFTVFDVDGEPTAVVATDPGSPALPAALATGRAAGDAGEGVVGTSAFVGDGPGDTLVLPGDVEVTVVGTATGATFNILPTVFTDRASVAAATAARAGAAVRLPISALAVTAAEGTDPAELAARIGAEVAGVEAVTRDVAIASLPGAGTITRSFSILYVLLYLVVAIVTAVFFQILTVQKRDALVLLRAVGGRSIDLVRPVLIQVLVVVGGAVVLGTAAAVGLLAGARDVFGATLSGSTIVVSAGLLLLLGLAAGLLSVRRVLAVDPVEAVRGGGLR